MGAAVADEPTFEEIKEILEAQRCPACQAPVGSLTAEEKFIARRIGDHALSGSRLKVSAVKTIVVSCSGCGRVGRVEAHYADRGPAAPV